VLMLSNQLPFLQIAQPPPEVSGQIESYCRREGGIICGGPSVSIISPIVKIMLGFSKSSCNSIYSLLIISL
jgi:hypothetical protein